MVKDDFGMLDEEKVEWEANWVDWKLYRHSVGVQ